MFNNDVDLLGNCMRCGRHVYSTSGCPCTPIFIIPTTQETTMVISKHTLPEHVFSYSALEEWALRNGFVRRM
jgi:hypothetical protein